MGLTDRETVSIMRAAELLRVSRRTIYNWIASGRVNYCRTLGGAIRLFEDELLVLQERPEPIPISQATRLPAPRTFL